MLRPVAIYLRSSKDRKDVSPDAQRRGLQELAASRDETVVEEFLDTVESGKDEHRPGFQALIKAVRNPNRGWDTLLIYDTSRLSRRRVISLIFEEVDCKRAGVQVVYRSLPSVDPLTEMLLKSILTAWDEYHSISSRQKGLAGMSENVRAGFRAGGRAPMGYRLKKIGTGTIREGSEVTKSVLEPEPDTASRVATYLADRAAGVPRKRAVARAGLQDVPSTTLIGMEWNALTYAGNTVWNVHAERAGGKYVGGSKRRPRCEWLIEADTHPALISAAEAEQLLWRLEAQAKARRAKAGEQRGRVSEALLSGVLFAPDGSKWWGEKDRYRYAQDGRQRSVSRHVIEEPVVEKILDDLASPEFAQVLVDGVRKTIAGDVDRSEIRRARAEVAALASQVGKAMDLALQLSDPAPALRKVDDLEAQRAEKALVVAQLELEAQRAAAVDEISAEDVHRAFADLAEMARSADNSEMRAALLSVVDRIELDPQTLEAAMHYRIAAPDSGVKVASPRGFEPRCPP